MMRTPRTGRTFLTLSLLVALPFALSAKAQETTFGQEPIVISTNIDPHHLVNQTALREALDYFAAHQKIIENKQYLTVIDFSLYSGLPRFHVINLQTGEVESLLTAHGKGSDPENTGYADHFSNEGGTHMSSLGPYLTGDTYDGAHGLSLYLDGLAPTNSNARDRTIVIHGAEYVDPSRQKMGRSWGCPALPMSDYQRVIGLIKQKSLLYIWSNR